MSVIARQSTARTVIIGPVLDADGVAVTGSVVGDFKIAKNGAAPAALNGSATATHRATGHYSLALTASDLDTVGQAEIVSDDTVNAMPVKVVTVVEEAVYDALFAASAAGYSTYAGGAVASVTGNVGGNVTGSVGSVASGGITAASFGANAITAAKLDPDVTTELQAGLATAASLTTVEGKIDTLDTNVDTLLTRITSTLFTGITSLAEWLGLMAGKQTGNSTARTEVRATGAGSGTYDETTDALQALRDNLATATALQTVDDEVATLQTSVNDLPTNAELATSQAAADDATLAAIAALNNLSAAQVNAEVDAAIETYHLDHLLAVTYDPASKPGASDALLNELVENDGGVARFTANALEEAPSGSGSGATAQEVWEYADRTLTALDEDSTTIDLDAAIRAAVGLASANLDTQLSAIDTVVDSILVDTGTDIPATLTTVAAYLDTEVAAILEDTGTTLPAQIAALNNLSAAQVNAEVVDCLNVDAYTIPSQGSPGTSVSIVTALGYLFKAFRNKCEQTSTAYILYADNGSTVDQRASCSDDGSVFTRSKVETGP
jgi:hypothetical protein